MKTCNACLEEKNEAEFTVRNDRSGRLRPYCKECGKDSQRARYLKHKRDSPFKHRCARARTRAKSLGVPFDLTPDYLESIWTGECAAFNIPLDLNAERGDELAPELDRFIPKLGYVQGNVHWLSRRANRLKNNVTSVELKQLIKWMEDVETNKS